MIKWPMCVNQMGAKDTVTRTKWLGFASALLITIGHVTERVLLDPMALPTYKVLNIAKLPKTMPHDRGPFEKVMIILCVLCNVVEFICFTIILYELNKQRRRQAALCLSKAPMRARKRKRRNAITSVGHFVSWLVEAIMFGLISFAIMEYGCGDCLSLTHMIIIVLIPSINYVLIPLVQITTSDDLRANVFHYGWCKKEERMCLKWKKNEEPP